MATSTHPYKYPLNSPRYKGEKTPLAFSDGPTKKRGCTDFLMLTAFGLFWTGMIMIAIYAYNSGDPKLMLLPYDSGGYK